jgi:hypothetical protein
VTFLEEIGGRSRSATNRTSSGKGRRFNGTFCQWKNWLFLMPFLGRKSVHKNTRYANGYKVNVEELRERLQKISEKELLDFRQGVKHTCSPEVNWNQPPLQVWVIHMKVWCGRWDSNPHALRRHPLKMVRLPVPPLPQWGGRLESGL